MATMFYEQGTGAWGDASQLLIMRAPEDDSIYGDPLADDLVWEHMNGSDSVSVADIVEVLLAASERKGDWMAGIDSLLAVLDPEEDK